jgi:hypothetical protein
MRSGTDHEGVEWNSEAIGNARGTSGVSIQNNNWQRVSHTYKFEVSLNFGAIMEGD